MAAGAKGIKARLTARWHAARKRYESLDHTVRGYGHYKDEHGDHLAAAITFFSFLAMFPLALLGVSITGFVLAGNRHLQQELFAKIAKNVPGSFGDTLTSVINGAINHRSAVGVVGLVGVALTGLGWIDNLRTAVDAIWGRPEPKLNFIAKKGQDALILLGLGLATVLSLAITALGTAVSHQVLVWVRLDQLPGMGTLTAALAILLAVLGDLLVFGWVIIRLPDAPVSRRTALKASLLAAVGFEILKLIGTFYIARVTRSPAGAAIGPVLGILVWINLVSRYLLFSVAWAATARDAQQLPDPLQQPVAGPPVPPPVQREALSLSPVGVAAGLLSAGATIGAATVAVLQRRARR
ncbi:MAG TPA: YhjD/YihY/BrkB family envelope integrity protein [Jatrophihabitans sp.]|nr:YhjD/YihY/BrkB family envelope integrity protein [Jatrophihabitans sp.]